MSRAVPVHEPGSNPLDVPDTSDGLARRIDHETGPVVTRQMTPEERARYGPKRPTRADIEEAVKQELSQFEVAARFETTLEHVKQAAASFGMAFALRELPRQRYLVNLITQFPRRRILGAMTEHATTAEASKALGLSKNYWWLLTRAYGLNITQVRKQAGLKAPPGQVIHPLPYGVVSAQASRPADDRGTITPGPSADAATLGKSLRRIARALRDNDHGDLTADELDLLNIIDVLATQAVQRQTPPQPEQPVVAIAKLSEGFARLAEDLAGHNHQFQGAWTGPAEAPRRSMRSA